MITVVKGTLFVDIDGTILHDASNEPIQNAVETINKGFDEGYMVILTTYRGSNFPLQHKFGKIETLKTLDRAGLKFHNIIWDSPSPRIIINDEGCLAIKQIKNSPWKENFIP